MMIKGFKMFIFISGKEITLAGWRKSLRGCVVFDRTMVTVLLQELENCHNNHNEVIFTEVCKLFRRYIFKVIMVITDKDTMCLINIENSPFSPSLRS